MYYMILHNPFLTQKANMQISILAFWPRIGLCNTLKPLDFLPEKNPMKSRH